MLYECTESNCNIGREHCDNRAITDLEKRVKTKSAYDIGVEVVETKSKGFGVRACRSYEPGQAIVEYTGEIITSDECEQRKSTTYKDNKVGFDSRITDCSVLR